MIDGDVEPFGCLRAPDDEKALIQGPEAPKFVAVEADEEAHEHRR